MRAGVKCSLALVFGLHAIQAETAERLGGISDETAPVAEQPAGREGDIIYRVICSPEGEILPECGQPPVSDSFKAAQPAQNGPVVPDMPSGINEEEDAGEAPVKALEPVGTSKKAAKHKKHSKKSAKKTHKPAKKAKHR